MEIRVAMVCMGNICRSPIAEHVLRAKANELGIPLAVASAGTGGWHAGEPADHRAVAVLERHGYTSDHRAQQFGADWFERFDHILVMDRDNLRDVLRLAPDASARAKVRLLGDFHPETAGDLEVPDPYYGGAADFEHTLRLVELSCEGFLAKLQQG